MKHRPRIAVFTDRYPWLGSAVWMATVEYFVVQLVVATTFHGGFSLRFNTISDLGNTACGLYGDRQVCSPWHGLMNLGFVLLGVLMAGGSLLMYQEFHKTRLHRLGFSLLGLAGVGSVLVGLFPENTIAGLHILGASLPFVLGNIGLVVFGLSLQLPRWFRVYSVASGVVALIALVGFVTHHYGWLGSGGVERIVAYPQTIWLIAFGMYMTRNRYLSRRQGSKAR